MSITQLMFPLPKNKILITWVMLWAIWILDNLLNNSNINPQFSNNKINSLAHSNSSQASKNKATNKTNLQMTFSVEVHSTITTTTSEDKANKMFSNSNKTFSVVLTVALMTTLPRTMHSSNNNNTIFLICSEIKK